MKKYYTRVCNFYYGNISKNLVKKKKTIPLNGDLKISFDHIEILSRKSVKKIHIKDIKKLPKNLIEQINLTKNLFVIEEHVAQGGIGSQISLVLIKNNISVKRFTHLFATSHHYDKSGSQTYLRKKCGIDLNNVMSRLQFQS